MAKFLFIVLILALGVAYPWLIIVAFIVWLITRAITPAEANDAIKAQYKRYQERTKK